MTDPEPSCSDPLVAKRHSNRNLGPSGPNENPQVFAWLPDIQPNNQTHVDKVTPGFGEQNLSCGEVRFKVLCPDEPGHFTRNNAYRCHRPECPVCYPSWAARAAERAADIIDGYQSATGTPYMARHITVSPDPDVFPFTEATPEALQYLYAEGRRVVGLLGVTAAAVIAHPYRIKKQYQRIVKTLSKQAGLNRYVWALQQPNWYDLVYFSPHLHIIAYGPLMDGGLFEKKTGWKYVNHDGAGDTGRTGSALKRTVYYLLTHAWVRGNNKAVRNWLGMSSTKLECRQLPSIKEPIYCPVCNAHAVKVPADIVDAAGVSHAFYQDLHNAEHAYRKVIVRIYFVRKKKTHVRCPSRTIARSLDIWGPAGPPGAIP